MSYLLWLLQARPLTHPNSPPPPGVNVHISPIRKVLRVGRRGHSLQDMHEDIISYLLIAAEITIKSPRCYTDIPTFIITFFTDLYIKLLGVRKQNNSLLFCVFWQNVRNRYRVGKNLLELHCPAT